MSYVLEGPKWGEPLHGTSSGTITWAFARSSWGGYDFDAAISDPMFQQAIREALALWESVAQLSFVEIADSATTMLRFGWDYIDGAFNTVGEAAWSATSIDGINYSIDAAEVRFDTAEDWSVRSNTSTSFLAVAVHEIGHALGLGHVHDPDQIMNPMMTDLQTLGPGDVEGIQTLYGARSFRASAGNDVFVLTAGDDSLDGLGGRDAAIFSAGRTTYQITKSGDSIIVSGDGSDILINIERLIFADGTLAFDFDGNAGQAYRVYQAAFDRMPDTSGLSYWINALDAGLDPMKMAEGFVNSNEFLDLYGAELTNRGFVNALYHNILDREGETDGVSYWSEALDTGTSRASVLFGFSESLENTVQLAPVIADGIWFI